MNGPSLSLLRQRDEAAKVISLELFFDLVYVFAITQLSHYLLQHLTLLGALQTATLWFAVWLLLAPLMSGLNLLAAGALITGVMIVVTVWESYARRHPGAAVVAGHAG